MIQIYIIILIAQTMRKISNIFVNFLVIYNVFILIKKFKNDYFIYVNLYVLVWVNATCMWVFIDVIYSWHWILWNCTYRWLNWKKWVLGTEYGFSGRAAGALCYQAISSIQMKDFWNVLIALKVWVMKLLKNILHVVIYLFISPCFREM